MPLGRTHKRYLVPSDNLVTVRVRWWRDGPRRSLFWVWNLIFTQGISCLAQYNCEKVDASGSVTAEAD